MLGEAYMCESEIVRLAFVLLCPLPAVVLLVELPNLYTLSKTNMFYDKFKISRQCLILWFPAVDLSSSGCQRLSSFVEHLTILSVVTCSCAVKSWSFSFELTCNLCSSYENSFSKSKHETLGGGMQWAYVCWIAVDKFICKNGRNIGLLLHQTLISHVCFVLQILWNVNFGFPLIKISVQRPAYEKFISNLIQLNLLT